MNKKIASAFAAALASALLLGGCSSLFRSGTPHDPADLVSLKGSAQTAAVWSVRVGKSENSFLTPAVTSNAIYAAGSDSLSRIDPSSGSLVWSARVKSEVTSGVGSDGYYAALGTADGQVVVFSAEGRELWRKKLSAEMDMPPLVGRDLVIVHTSDTRITAFRAKSGEQVWRYQGQVPILSVRAPRQMIFFADGLLVGNAGGKLIGVSMTGKPALEAAISQPSGITEVERLNDVVGAPLVTGGLLCAATYQGRLTCMSSRNGVTRWSVKVDAVTGPTADARAVYVVDSKGVIHAYSKDSGAEIWKNATMTYRANSSPVPLGRYLACGDFEGYVHLLDPLTGAEQGRGRLSGAVVTNPVAMGDGAVFQTNKGEVALVRAR
ncbi:outer membrane protein assembly factor BamB [Mesosutterella sp. OilRF-GAM-744-9]|uniref:Outer membrane protein assembly factor BamB n=1 Tax=Mesosutterella porci TaxID=2915351 RepID=A0ABS9MT71_9BURK|nr:outer membrane protein assembly factor BamB [Mesosutterella sp. oilRF-744-WT-GAM-9]MCG5031820.1 outer membrane protein assembly factor BamB [Mesosutterella sp. oilRF-744-WT-GAM-9]